ncbi:MAG TPA: dihydrolipoamide acetyltransferase family protein [Vicinamibacterales bacterium]|nr:dihydrolipoamide acetyltransferase family protein [Vicinamibacterales bacterium]
MAISVVMPALEMAQDSGKLVSWLKQEGESVRKGEMLLEVETDKAVVEVEASADGILAGVTAKPGDVVQVGHTIAWLVQPGEAPPAAVSQPAAVASAAVASPMAAVPSVSAPARGAARISPKARRLAQEKGVDISRLTGSGPGGEILADDILAAAKGSDPGDTATQHLESTHHRGLTPTIGRLMAERTTQSWTTVPHFFVTRDVDASALNEARERLLPAIERSHRVKVTHTDLLVAIVARTLGKHPRLNASWTPDGIVQHDQMNIALAIGVENAVVTAVIPNADRAALGDMAVRRRELAERAQAGRLQPADIANATFTISNLGMFEVDAFTAIIVPPQAAILAVGAIAERVVAVNGQPAVRPMMSLTVSCDHRVVDGVRAAEFMRDLASAIRSPQL